MIPVFSSGELSNSLDETVAILGDVLDIVVICALFINQNDGTKGTLIVEFDYIVVLVLMVPIDILSVAMTQSYQHH